MASNHFFRIGFFLLVMIVFLLPNSVSAQNPLPGWSFPLPAGQYKISQGDKDDPACSSHCAGTGPWDEYALDIIQASGGSDKINGMPVLSAAPGTVIASGTDSQGGGEYVAIRHENGYVSLYLHLKEGTRIKVNTQVDKGAVIGEVGDTGKNVSGPHLHFAVIENWGSKDLRGVEITSLDGQSNFHTGVSIRSYNSELKPNLEQPTESDGSAKIKPGILDQITQEINQFLGVNQPAPQPPVVAAPGNPPQVLPHVSVGGAPVAPQPPIGKPSLLNPGNGASMTQNTDITLSWNAPSGASQYKAELWGGPYGVMPSCDWQSGTSCHIGQMRSGTMSWHVKARDANGQESDWSDPWSFTVGQAPIIAPPPVKTERPPDQFHLISPSGDVQLSNGTLPNLQWQSTSDPDGDQVQYDVIIDNANSPEARQPGQPSHVESGLLTGTSWQPIGSGLEKGGRYTWYVLADDAHGNRTGSIEHWQFTIALPHLSAYDPCPTGVGPGGIKPGSYPPTSLTQAQRQWLFEIFGNKGIASDGYGGQDCGKSPPPPVLPPPPTNTSTPTLAPAIVPARPISATPTNTKVPPTYTPTFTPTPTNTPVPPPPCPSGVGPGGIKPGSYPPTSLTQAQRQWLFNIFGHSGIASDGYGGENCQ